MPKYPKCDTCERTMNYMPWHYSQGELRHLHACSSCWPIVNPAKQCRLSEQEIRNELACALRQFRHNDDNSPSMCMPEQGFVFAYDMQVIDRLINKLTKEV